MIIDRLHHTGRLRHTYRILSKFFGGTRHQNPQWRRHVNIYFLISHAGMSQAQVARIYQMSRNTVYLVYKRARRRLKGEYETFYDRTRFRGSR